MISLSNLNKMRMKDSIRSISKKTMGMEMIVINYYDLIFDDEDGMNRISKIISKLGIMYFTSTNGTMVFEDGTCISNNVLSDYFNRYDTRMVNTIKSLDINSRFKDFNKVSDVTDYEYTKY